MTEPAVTPSRYHALDSLRAAMMFLGIFLHIVVAYSPTAPWLYKPAQLTKSLDYAMFWIHVFRMPVFYVMAGFFTALLLQRYVAYHRKPRGAYCGSLRRRLDRRLSADDVLGLAGTQGSVGRR
jgi:hypothetical protein